MTKASLKNKEYKEFIKELKKIEKENGVYNIRSIFQDFILIVTIAIKNTYAYSKEDQEKLLEIANKYKEEEIRKFDELLVILTKIYKEQKEIHDVLGQIYEDLGFTNRMANQFFIPSEIASLMTSLTVDKEIEEIKEGLKNKEFISICNDYCHAGITILNCVRRTKIKIENCLEKMVFIAKDTDINCICMTFIQLTMNKIPAKIIWEKELTEEVIKILYTPEFIKGNWFKKLSSRGKEEK